MVLKPMKTGTINIPIAATATEVTRATRSNSPLSSLRANERPDRYR